MKGHSSYAYFPQLDALILVSKIQQNHVEICKKPHGEH